MFPLLLCRLVNDCLSYTNFAGHSLLTTSIGHICGHSSLPTGNYHTCGHSSLTTSVGQTGAIDCSVVPKKTIKNTKTLHVLAESTLHYSLPKFTYTMSNGQTLHTAIKTTKIRKVPANLHMQPQGANRQYYMLKENNQNKKIQRRITRISSKASLSSV